MDGIAITLRHSPEEAHGRDASFQEGLVAVTGALRSTGLRYSQRFTTFDAAGAIGSSLPEFTLMLTQAAIPAVAAILGAWLQARFGRKVRVKVGDLEAEGKTPEEVESLLRMAEQFRASGVGKTVDPK